MNETQRTALTGFRYRILAHNVTGYWARIKNELATVRALKRYSDDASGEARDLKLLRQAAANAVFVTWAKEHDSDSSVGPWNPSQDENSLEASAFVGNTGSGRFTVTFLEGSSLVRDYAFAAD